MAIDAIVLLGCRVSSAGAPGAAAARRVERAALAFAEGVAPVIVASGGRRWGNQVEARVLSRSLADLGVPPDAVLEELWSFTTTENALFSTLLLSRTTPRRAPKIGLVTCSWHMDRAADSFRTAGAEVTPLPAVDPQSPSLARRFAERTRASFDSRAVRRKDVFERAAQFARIGAR